jgi:hypothetical protein
MSMVLLIRLRRTCRRSPNLLSSTRTAAADWLAAAVPSLRHTHNIQKQQHIAELCQ